MICPLMIFNQQQIYHNFLSQFRAQDINYKEENAVLIDYRQGTLGFYWVDLNTTSSDEESKRMGHCGKDSFGDLFSFRSLEQDKSLTGIRSSLSFWRGTSWLTAAVNKQGHIRQLKTLKNARPKERFLLSVKKKLE